MAEEEIRESLERAFQACGEPLEAVTLFKYLVRVLMAGGEEWAAVIDNLTKARKIWTQMTRILGREGADPMI